MDSTNPERSLLLLKLMDPAACGSPMPLGSGPAGLQQVQIDCVGAYVRDLALPKR